ncbi:unnamed protein product [Cylicostephanus goldi]|uniref:Uncharacterized protein n=1 Tax=Cylicostephanus goldi TaxID=71465 RepID=A0A3P7PW90_CYLGO|nr:unnamed protein product [Cylicostephanus goldi]
MLTSADIDQVRIWAGCVVPGTAQSCAYLGMVIIVIAWVYGAIEFIMYWPIFQRRVEGAVKGCKEAVEVDEERDGESEGAGKLGRQRKWRFTVSSGASRWKRVRGGWTQDFWVQ